MAVRFGIFLKAAFSDHPPYISPSPCTPLGLFEQWWRWTAKYAIERLMSQDITDTLKSRVACRGKKSMTVWMSSSPSSLPKQPANDRPSPHLSARSLSLSNKTRTHLARPCGLNWISYTRLFRHCVLAWESPSHPSENSRQEGHLQHLSADLRVGVSQGRRGVSGKGRIASLSLCPSLVPSVEWDLSGCCIV